MFGVILDLDFQRPGAMIRVVLSAKAAEMFKPPLSYNPDHEAGILDRSRWRIRQLHPVQVLNGMTGSLEPAHVCELEHL